MKEGDFVRIDFDAFVKETDQLMDTTHEEVAKEHDVFDERANYKPIAVIVGSGNVIKGLDEDLKKAEKGKEREVEIPPADGYGERDPKLIEVFPMNKILSLPEFRKGDKYPTEGMDIRINNRVGIINRIFAGRVRVDFNQRFAGKTLLYKYKVTEVIEKKEEKVKAVIESAYTSPSEFSLDFKGDDEVDITLPDMVKLDQGWAMAKFKLVSDLRNHLDLRIIRLIEEYVRKEETPEETASDDEQDLKASDDESKKEEKKEETDTKDEDKKEEDDDKKE